MKILLVEALNEPAQGWVQSLQEAGYVVDCVSSGEEAEAQLKQHAYDGVMLDVCLPDITGLELLQRVRARTARLAVMLLSANSTVAERVEGFNHGADDYLPKPFEFVELEARLRALMRRSQLVYHPEVCVGGLRYDSLGKRLFFEEQALDLSARELHLVALLMRHAGKIFDKQDLLRHLYAMHEHVSPNAIEVAVHRLRKKLAPTGCVLRTIRGLGYLLDVPAGGEVLP